MVVRRGRTYQVGNVNSGINIFQLEIKSVVKLWNKICRWAILIKAVMFELVLQVVDVVKMVWC